MLELAFSDTTGGIIRAAKHDGVPGLQRHPVVSIFTMFEIGSIRESIESDYRRNLPIDTIIAEFDEKEYLIDDSDCEECNETEYLSSQDPRWQKVLSYAKIGRQIRIWYSETPEELCGLYFACHALQEYPLLKLWIIKLPERVLLENNIYVISQGWGCATNKTVEESIGKAERLNPQEIKLYADKWAELMEENAPLRAVISGHIVSVDEDFYDGLILRVMGDKPIVEIKLLEKLCAMGLSVGYSWYLIRVHKMITDGRISIIQDHQLRKRRVLCRHSITEYDQ